MKLINKILLTSTMALPAFGITTSLTGCSNVWGYQNPLHFGSYYQDDDNNPFKNFVGESGYTDADGNDIINYIPHDYIVDQSKTINYAFASPASTWYDKEDSDNEHILPTSEWKYEKDGWITPSNTTVETQVSLTKKEDDVKVVRSYINNLNTNILKYIDVSAKIASSIAGYIAYGLQYQASQISAEDTTEEDLNVAWGKGSSLASSINNLDHGSKEDAAADVEKVQNRRFYEMIFSTANMHAAKETKAYMKPVNVNFNYDIMPIPSYNLLAEPEEGEIDYKNDLTQHSLQLLLGKIYHNSTLVDDIHLYEAGTTRSDGTQIPAYYSLKQEQKATLKYTDTATSEEKTINGKYWAFQFANVPILVHAKDLTYTWINPMVKDSFIPSDYYVKDQEVVTEAIGSSWQNMSKFVDKDCDLTPQSIAFDVDTENDSHVKTEIKKGTVEENQVWDTRLVQQCSELEDGTADGNTFVVLATYNAFCYDDPEFAKGYAKELGLDPDTDPDWEKKLPVELQTNYLKRYNVMDIASVNDIFPTYFLSLDTSTYKKKDKVVEKYIQAIESDVVDFVPGYIINSELINMLNTNLLNLFQRKSGDGFIAHAKDVSSESKELLTFLTYMFGKTSGNKIDLNTNNFMFNKTW